MNIYATTKSHQQSKQWHIMELSVDYFRKELDMETQTLTKFCEKWSQVLEANNNSPDDLYGEEALGAIRTVIGQAQLLLTKKFKQFSELISHCENKTGDLPTRLDDLSGFWDMVRFQVDDVHKKFKLLEVSQPNDK